MRELTEQLWRAGKYGAGGIAVLATLPVLVPSAFVLSVLLFTFVLPLLCAVAGFLYLRKHATRVYRYLPGVGSRSFGADSSHRRLPLVPSRFGNFTLLELLRKDADSTDTLEAVDQELDAVLVNSIPKFEKVVPETLPTVDTAQQFESREKEGAVQRTTSADTSSESAELKNADRDGCHEKPGADVEDVKGVDLISSGTKSSEGPGNVEERKEEKKNLSNITDSDVYEGEIATLSEHGKEGITSGNSCAVHPEVVTTERIVSCLNPVSSSGASRPESVSLDSASSKLHVRSDESTSDHETFESTSDASFEAPQWEKESDSEDEKDNHSLHSQSTRGTENVHDDDDDDRDDASLSDEDTNYYERLSEVPQRGDRGDEEIARAPETVLAGDVTSGYPSTTSRESDASEEKAGMMRSSRSDSALSEYMYDSDEQMHLQQVHDEQQLREELKAIKNIVGDDEASSRPLVTDIEELSEILGIELPSTDDIPEFEWAKVAIEVMKVVIGVE